MQFRSTSAKAQIRDTMCDKSENEGHRLWFMQEAEDAVGFLPLV